MSLPICFNDQIYPLLPISCTECPREQTCSIFAEICEEQFALAELKAAEMLAENGPMTSGEIPF